MTKRAIGIIRVSDIDGRDGDSFASPDIQADRMRQYCQRENIQLLDIHDELDVSGGKALTKRPGLSKAVASIEAGHADVLVAAYFDRLFRSLKTQEEVVERVEKVGGKVLALDVGHISSETAGQWLSGTMLGVVSEYYRRSIGERIHASDARAVARGVIPFPRIPPGLTRQPDGTVAPNELAPMIREAFEMKASGATWQAIRDFLLPHGIDRNPSSLRNMFASRLYYGELRFGDKIPPNPNAYENPIVSRELWDAAQRVKSKRGPVPPSDRLLARLGILRCYACGRAMGPAKLREHRGEPYWIYRCPTANDCKNHVAIHAPTVERAVGEVVKAVIASVGVNGHASTGSEAERRLEAVSAAEKRYQRAKRIAFESDTEDDSDVIEAIATAKAYLDAALRDADQYRHLAKRRLTGDENYDLASVELKREYIRLVFSRITVGPASPRRRWDGLAGILGRMTFDLFEQYSLSCSVSDVLEALSEAV